jgi:hypothetical protein
VRRSWLDDVRGGGARPVQAKEEERGRQGWLGQKAEWASWLLGRLGRKLKNPFGIKFRFLIYQGFENLHKEI